MRKPHQKPAMGFTLFLTEVKPGTGVYWTKITQIVTGFAWLALSRDCLMNNDRPWRSLEKVAKLIHTSYHHKTVDFSNTLLTRTRDDNVKKWVVIFEMSCSDFFVKLWKTSYCNFILVLLFWNHDSVTLSFLFCLPLYCIQTLTSSCNVGCYLLFLCCTFCEMFPNLLIMRSAPAFSYKNKPIIANSF